MTIGAQRCASGRINWRPATGWFIDHVAEGWRGGVMAAFAIEFQGYFAGTIDLRLQEGEWAEVGFGLAPWARGQHVMRRSLTSLWSGRSMNSSWPGCAAWIGTVLRDEI